MPANKIFTSIVAGTLLLLGFVLAGCSPTREEVTALPYFNSPDFTPEWDGSKGHAHTIADFNFQDQQGQWVSQETFAGKIYIADFFFTYCTGICPKMTTNMARLQERFRDNPHVMLLSHTVMPWADSIPRLADYAESQGVNHDKWKMVTGSKEELYTIARKSYFAEEEMGYVRGAEGFLHTENFILVDQNRRIRGIYNGTLGVEIDRLKADVDLLMREMAI